MRNSSSPQFRGVKSPACIRSTLRRMAVATAALAFVPIGVQAQTGQITGTVSTANTGAPLGEVQVYLVGEELGSLSRADGRFLILNVPVGSYEVRAERIGYETTTQSVQVTSGGTTTVEFRLPEQALGLDEIVVTGTAGASRRREIGNAISQINVADVADRPISTTDLLQGAAPGVDITGGSGELGQGKQIRLRGNSSVSMTNQPIIYIDGVRMMDGAFPTVDGADFPGGRGALVTVSPLDNINPNDIDRIEIIKGSAATTLYGTEASAGVIQVFTKRGSQGAPVWTAEVQQGTGWIQQFGAPGAQYLHMEHYMRDAWWGGGYEGGDLSESCVTDENSRWGNHHSSGEGACSWPGAVWLQNYNLSVRGGAQTLQYFVSGQYQNDTGALPRDELEKYNFRGNFTMTPAEGLQLQWNTGFTSQWMSNTSTGNNAQGITLNAFRQERSYFATRDPERMAVVLDYDLQQRIERLTTGGTVVYSPMPDFTNRFTVGYDFSSQEGRNLRDFGFEQFPQGGLMNSTWQKRLLTFDYVGTYSFRLSEALRSNFSWGGQAVGDEVRQVEAWGEDFPGAAEPTVGSAALTTGNEERQKVWTAGFFFQNVFDISNRYFITAGLRVDGNSAFGEGFGLQVYPKVSGSWVISDEEFWSEGMGSLKLRAAYGQSGRAPGAFDAVRTWDPAGFAGLPAFIPQNLGNPELGPEVTAEWELGFDGSWFGDRLSAGLTYFDQTTTDALMSVSSIPSEGFGGSQLENVGEISNKGLELQLNAGVVQGQSWAWDVGVGITTNKSEVIDLGGVAEFNDLNGRIMVGQPVPVMWDQRVANPDEIAPYEYANGGEPVVIGPGMPTHYVTPNMSLRIPGNVVLAARGEYRGGHYMEVNEISISRSVRSPLCFPYYVDPATSIELRADTPALWRERCTPDAGDDYWFDADYFKLRSVSATIPVDFAFPDRVSNAILTLALNNAWDWHREIPWYDTEILGNAAANDDGIGNPSERIPAPATFRISLRVTF